MNVYTSESRHPRSTKLVVAPAWVGDMVMAHGLVSGLVERGSTVHFLAPRATVDLAKRMPGVAVVHTLAVRRGRVDLLERNAAARRLRDVGFDQAIVLPNSFKSALPPWFAGIPRRTGFTGEARFGLLNDRRSLDAERWPRLVDRFAALADVAPSPPRLRFDPERRRQLLDKHGLATDRPVVALCPGAEYGAAKRWPAEHFAVLARRVAAAGATVWLLGSERDRDPAAEIARGAKVCNLAGKTALLDAVDLLSAASAVVANDSGLMHVAAALGVPVAALYGSTTPAFTPPLSDKAVVIEQDGLACRPCFRRECPLGHLACLRKISAERVFETLTQLDGFPR